MYVFICEDSLEGIFTGVYDACASRLGHRNIRLATGEPENYELFSEYIHVTPSADKTGKVIYVGKAKLLKDRQGDPHHHVPFRHAVL